MIKDEGKAMLRCTSKRLKPRDKTCSLLAILRDKESHLMGGKGWGRVVG